MPVIRPDIYEMLDTLTLKEKEELLEHLKVTIELEKSAPEKSYLEEEWAEIKRLIEVLKYEPYIDDQFEITEIWEICEKMIKSRKLKKEPWGTRRRVLKSIIGGQFYDYYGVYDPMKDLFYALMFSDEERLECADIIYDIGSDYMKGFGAELYKECGKPEAYYDYLESHLASDQKPYIELIEYYRKIDVARAIEIAELGLQKCKRDQTDIMLFLIENARDTGNTKGYERFMKSAKLRRAVDFSKIAEALGL